MSEELSGPEEGYDFLEPNLDDAQELTTLPEDTEVKVEITAVDPPIKGKYSLRVTLDIVDDPFTKSITNFLNFPKRGDSTKKINNKKLMLRDFCQAFGVELPSVAGASTPEELKSIYESHWVGRSGYAILAAPSDPRWGNEVKRFVVPK
jgi:hypothetical protein